MPHRILEKLNLAEIASAPATGFATAGATVSAGYASYFDQLSTLTGIIATVFGMALSMIIIRVNLTNLKHSKQKEKDRQEQSALDRRKIEFEIQILKTDINKRKKANKQAA